MSFSARPSPFLYGKRATELFVFLRLAIVFCKLVAASVVVASQVKVLPPSFSGLVNFSVIEPKLCLNQLSYSLIGLSKYFPIFSCIVIIQVQNLVRAFD
jgi:hypothetical protein